jgi:FMN phosphatase YigB (HAD superfamily)
MKHILVFDWDNCMFDSHGIDGPVALYPEVYDVVTDLATRHMLVLLTAGERPNQWDKILQTDIVRNFNHVMIVTEKGHKKFTMLEVLRRIPEVTSSNNEVIVCGDRIDLEIKFANELGYTSVRMRRGKYKGDAPRLKDEEPDHTVYNFLELRAICDG